MQRRRPSLSLAAGTRAAAVALALAAAPAAAQPWTHDPGSELGPERWGELAPAFRTCGSRIAGLAGFQETGRRQSPIDISATTRARLPRLLFGYVETELEVENNGHTIEVPYQPGSSLRVGDQVFALRQFHFHAPSEHTIAGRSWDMELHLVHTDALGANAVVGVVLEVGASPNAAIEEIFAHAPVEEGSAHVAGAIDATDLLPRSLGYYTYAGSLTTPPCTEGVLWIVLRRPVQVSRETVELFHELIGDFPGYDGFASNARPVRPRNDRIVLEKR